VASPKLSRCIKLIGCAIGYGSSLWLGIGWQSITLAQQNVDSSIPELCQVNLSLLKSNSSRDRQHIITADTVSSKGMTLPSLWWTNEQFPAKLVTNWIADSTDKQIYLLINARYWNVLDYIDRYRLVDQFGRVAQGYGYNLQLCSSQKAVLARYTCGEGESQASCQISLKATGQAGMGVQSK
jgi:hypothetical protein